MPAQSTRTQTKKMFSYSSRPCEKKTEDSRIAGEQQTLLRSAVRPTPPEYTTRHISAMATTPATKARVLTHKRRNTGEACAQSAAGHSTHARRQACMNAGRRCRLYYSSHREQAATCGGKCPFSVPFRENFFPRKKSHLAREFPATLPLVSASTCEAAALPVHHRDGAHKRQEGAARLVRQASAG